MFSWLHKAMGKNNCLSLSVSDTATVTVIVWREKSLEGIVIDLAKYSSSPFFQAWLKGKASSRALRHRESRKKKREAQTGLHKWRTNGNNGIKPPCFNCVCHLTAQICVQERQHWMARGFPTEKCDFGWNRPQPTTAAKRGPVSWHYINFSCVSVVGR